MPGLQKLLIDTPYETNQQRMLRGNIIQTIGFLFDAVKASDQNEESFKEDAKKVMEIFSGILSSEEIKVNDSIVTAITGAITQLAALMKEDFAPFMPDLMTKLFEDSQVEVDFKLEDAELPNTNDEDLTTVTFKLKGLEGQKKLSLNTNALETKINAIGVTKALAQNLGTTYEPYVPATVEKFVPLFAYKFSRAVRGCAVECCQYLILALSKESDRIELMQSLTPAFEQCLAQYLERKDTDEVVTLLKEYYHCIREFKYPNAPLSETQIETIIKLCAESCKLAAEDKILTCEEIEKERHNIDEEDLEVYKEKLDEIEKAFMYTMEIAGQLMRMHRDDVTDVVKTHLSELFAKNIDKAENTEHEIIDSLCFFIDC